MSQNNDQGRRNPSQPWYDNGEAPQSKKFPFGTGGDHADSAPRQDAQGSTPAYGQPPVEGAPQAPQYGAHGQDSPDQQGRYRQDPNQQGRFDQQGQSGQQGNSYGQGRQSDHPTGEQAPGNRHDQQNQHDQQAQHDQGQYDRQGRHDQYQAAQQQGYQQGYDQQGQDSRGDMSQQPTNAGQNQQYPISGGQQPSDPAQQPFQGILDPHTGEIHPVPDLDGLQDTDALLVVVSGPDSGSQILLDTDVVTVGRSPNADIFLDDVTVSRKHAEFIRTPSGFTLRDTGSLNGTYVGRQLIDSIELQNGADVQIGKFRMIFQQRPRS